MRKLELAYSMLFTMPGSPIIYYGDEIGMGDNSTSLQPYPMTLTCDAI